MLFIHTLSSSTEVLSEDLGPSEKERREWSIERRIGPNEMRGRTGEGRGAVTPPCEGAQHGWAGFTLITKMMLGVGGDVLAVYSSVVGSIAGH